MSFNSQINDKESKAAARLLFWIGVFSQTQIRIGGSLGISEFVMVLFAPFIFLKSIAMLRKDGVLYYFWLVLFWLAGAIFVDMYTHNQLRLALRGIAVPITVFANSICIYALLRKNFDNLKWLLLGIAISGVISIFVFQRGGSGVVAEEHGLAAAAEDVMAYKLFWVFQLMTWLTLPICGWYLKTPKLYSFFALLFLSVFNLAAGGRSAFLVVFVSLLFIMLAGKSHASLQVFKKHILTILVLLALFGILAKSVYKYAATHGYMGEAEEMKYEKTTAQGSSLVDMIVAGRGQFFIGVMAALDKPLLGHGSVAIDNHGYVLDFHSKHGDQETYEQIVRMRREFGARVIPAHSHIIAYWLWHGIWAFVFWFCVISLAVKTVATRLHVYPPWFGYFAVTIPAFIWDVLFSPFGARVQESALFVAFLLVSKMSKDQKYGFRAV